MDKSEDSKLVNAEPETGENTQYTSSRSSETGDTKTVDVVDGTTEIGKPLGSIKGYIEHLDEGLAARRKPTYYTVLGCDPSASSEQINAEYHSRCLVLHPDKKAGNDCGECWNVLQEANKILSDPVTRSSCESH